MKDLSILIPARQEMYLAKTIEDILEHSEADIEINVVLDGAWPKPGVPQDDRVNIIYVADSIGQRQAINLACKSSTAKYVMKVDAHCSFDQGFDRKMVEFMEKVGDNVTAVPIMRHLWAFDWKCGKCGSRWYQGPTPTRCRIQERHVVDNDNCDETKNFSKVTTWLTESPDDGTARKNWKGRYAPRHAAYRFDSEPHFQYFGEFEGRPEGKGDATPTMSLQGSCWMLTRDKYWELNVCDHEGFGSWGSQGIEVSCKTWLSGGQVMVNHKTWYAHLFRTQGGDFSFPYPQDNRQIRDAKHYAKDLFFNNRWPQQIYPLSWLLEKFAPIPGWSEEDIRKIKEDEKTNWKK